MRLINTKTLKLVEFGYFEIPPYAILSHTWGQGEVLYEDLVSLRRTDGNKAGWAKLDHTTQRAATANFEYCWIDTCCIDSSNQVELTESINSMFDWYKEAKVCYAYLADVNHGEDYQQTDSSFAKSEWFKRGWTLQELLAPKNVVFLASNWKRIDRKENLAPIISTVTGIPRGFLLGTADLEAASIAQRLSWVSKRKTRKPEDRVYCLLGIVGIHMPLLYGEREAAAFKRLQQEILKEFDDTSIFAWGCVCDDHCHEESSDEVTGIIETSPLLARSPTCFAGSSNIVRASMPVLLGYHKGIRTPFTFNNKGLHLCLPMLKKHESRDSSDFAILDCQEAGGYRIGLELRDISTHGGRYVRVNSNTLFEVRNDFIKKHFVFQDITTETKLPNGPWPLLLHDHAKSARTSVVASHSSFTDSEQHGFIRILIPPRDVMDRSSNHAPDSGKEVSHKPHTEALGS